MATHFWGEKTLSLSFLLNEVCLLAIGVGVGIVFNLFLPVQLDEVQSIKRKVDEAIRSVLMDMSQKILSAEPYEESNLDELSTLIEQGKRGAENAMGNSLSSELSYYIEYFNMRLNQYRLLRQMAVNISMLKSAPTQASVISEMFSTLSITYAENNDGAISTAYHDKLTNYFREEPLPVSREEFEARAVLFVLLSQIRSFIRVKKVFTDNLSEETKRKFWNIEPAN
jgi:uncharacterized membrane protein YgaE (UPF0421/DUF939 family)